MFKKILIANRGEIACRIIKTASSMGIRTVAVYSDADAGARHVAMADQAFRIGPPAAAESYLRIERIIDACRASGAEAVHPGYGFLSENPDFVEAVEAAELTFIGPPASAIRAMGLKDAAKRLMDKAGVPVTPGYHGDGQDADVLAGHAQAIGYPVLIKARAGGGGKGMRRVNNPAEFQAALEGATREGLASFGDGRCLIERYITRPRHIEIQVFGDSHGNVVHLFERDCSLQRRHQKVIEEAPAPGMTDTMRAAMGEAAVRAAKAIGYEGAGTIEFIVDVSDGLKDDRFFFMEMNTRLQVEHPVTEMITGQDLVAWQIKVAAGQPLPCRQQDLRIDGWAFEARIYAEDVPKGFLPATGKLDHVLFPEDSARIDAGVREGDAITPFYDPMIAKVITHGASREEALSRLASALGRTRLVGTTTNLGFLSALAAHPDFGRGRVDTGLIERRLDQLLEAAEPPAPALALAALGALGFLTEPAVAPEARFDPWNDRRGWRLWGHGSHVVGLAQGDEATEIHVAIQGEDAYRVTLPGEAVDLERLAIDDIDVTAFIDGGKVAASVVRHGETVTVFMDGQTFAWTIPDPLEAADDGGFIAGDQLRAPMPGLIKLVQVGAGDRVAKGGPLLVMEAMKMEHTLKAPRDGVVGQCLVAVGDQVDDGALLLELQPDQKDDGPAE